MNSGIVCALISSVFFCVIGTGVKSLAAIPSLQIVLVRSVISLVAGIFVLRRKKIRLLGKRENFPFLFARGLTGTVGITLYFYTLKELGFGEAVTLQYLSPVFTAIFALVFLNERSNWLAWSLFPVAFLGVFLMYRVDLSWDNIALLAGIGSAVCSGCAYTCIRYLKVREDPNVIVLYFPLVTLPVAGLWCALNWVSPTAKEWSGLILVGIATHLAQYFMTRSFQLEKAGKIAMLGYLNVVIAFGAGYLFFNEESTPDQLTGVVVVLGSLILSAASEKILKSLRNVFVSSV